MERLILAGTSGLVMAIYACISQSSYLFLTSTDAAGERYNLLAQGFRSGQLSLNKEVPLGLARLADPYDPAAYSHYDVLDMSYYQGKLYLYFGVTPAVVLFWPYVALTGHYLPQKDAAVIFCLVGFLSSAGLLYALWRRYFAEVNVAVMAAGTIALGLATCMPFLLARCDVYEVSVSCGYALTMLALAAVWKALHGSATRLGWLAAASLAYGLAVGARPSLLFGAVVLLVPVVLAWRERQRVWAPLIAAIGPMAVIGCGLMLYNALRFDSPFEFGGHYQLGEDRRLTQHFWSVRYLWFNFRVYFLEPARWIHRFPFVQDIRIPTVPAGHGRVEKPFGVLANIPLVWLAVAVPLAWRKRSAEARSNLCGFLGVVVALFGICTLTLCLFFAACTRYEVEFLSALVLLAVVGILSVERALAPTSESGQADRAFWRRAARYGWGVLLGFSVAFNLFASATRCAEAHINLGYILERMGRTSDAITEYEKAIRLNPNDAEAHRMLGNRLFEAGKLSEAISQYQETVRLSPGWAEPHNNLGVALSQEGRLKEAAEQFREALRADPGSAEGHSNLAVVLGRLGNTLEALEQFELSLRSNPNDAETHYDYAVALEQAGLVNEARLHYEEALRLNPDLTQARNRLAGLKPTE